MIVIAAFVESLKITFIFLRCTFVYAMPISEKLVHQNICIVPKNVHAILEILCPPISFLLNKFLLFSA